MDSLSFTHTLRGRWWRSDLEVTLGRVRDTLLHQEHHQQDVLNFLEEQLLALFEGDRPEVALDATSFLGSQSSIDYRSLSIQQECWARKLDTAFELFREVVLQDGSQAVTEDIVTEFCAALRELSLSSDGTAIAPEPELQAIAASAVCETELVEKEFHVEVQARASGGGNNRALQGVMFRVNEPSEAIPNVGPGLPLYIPEEVARVAIEDFNRSPKPFDAHDSLTDHSLTTIVGVADRAELRGRDVVVKGWLFDFNQPTRVQHILANQKELGMSINASAAGHPSVVGGQQVWVVDKLHIYGANLLYAKRATYQQTRIAAGAKSSDDTLPGDESMNEVVQAQLKAIGDGVNGIGEAQAHLSGTIAELKLRLSALEAERNQELSEISASRKEEQRQSERKEFIQEIVGSVLEALPANTRGNGSRRTVPISARAGSTQGSDNSKDLMLQLSACRGALEALQAAPVPDRTKIYELIDQKRELEVRIAHSQGG